MRAPLRGAMAAGVWFVVAAGVAKPPEYPVSRTVEVADEIHGVAVPDPYRWLEEDEAPEVQAWTEAQNALTRALLDRFADERARLARRLEALYGAQVRSTPVVFGERYFHQKREGLQDHAVLYVCEGAVDATPKVVINPNTFSADGTVAMDWWHPSPDGRLIVYGKSASGSEKSTLYLRDVDSAADLSLTIPQTRACAVAWDPDGRGFLYTRYALPGTVPEGDENYHRRVYYHKFGTHWQDDPLIWGDGQPKEMWPNVENSSDDRFQFLSTSLDWTRNDLYIRPAGEGEFAPVAVGLDGLFGGDVLGEQLFLRTNFEAPRYRIVVAPVADPAPENWKDVIPEQNGVIASFTLADDKLVLNVLENAYSRLFIYERDGKLVKEVELPTLGTVRGVSGRPGRADFYFTFESFAYPPAVFRYELGTHTMSVIDRLEVEVPLAQYETQQVWFNSKDGTRVPMFVTYRKGLKLEGDNPTVMYGYGGFNISLTPNFYRGVIPFLDRGGVWAVVNLRGGGEFGKEWHLAGRLERKQNVFDDFVAAAEKLIADGYTKPGRLGARGGSNGGLLTGAMIVQRPDLFKAIACEVPLLDMVRYHRFAIARLWIPEYGSAEDAEQFRTLLAYSPYHHVEAGTAYPAVLLRTAEADSRVVPMHARKMAAALQQATASDEPMLLWVETKAGHGAGQPLRKEIDRQLDLWTFFMWQLGLFEPPAATQPADTLAPGTGE